MLPTVGVWLAVVPAGQATVGDDSKVLYTAPRSTSQITGVAPCPEYFYCLGGDPLTAVGLPQPCPDYLRSQPGADAPADCGGKYFY